MNVLDTSAWGLTSLEHWYGLPEALFTDRRVQDFPVDYNYNDESHRFGQAADGVLYLAGRRSGYITGEVLEIAGGRWR